MSSLRLSNRGICSCAACKTAAPSAAGKPESKQHKQKWNQPSIHTSKQTTNTYKQTYNHNHTNHAALVHHHSHDRSFLVRTSSPFFLVSPSTRFCSGLACSRRPSAAHSRRLRSSVITRRTAPSHLSLAISLARGGNGAAEAAEAAEHRRTAAP